MASRALPSLRTEPGSLIPIGFVDEPDSRHTAASIDAMQALVKVADALRSSGGRPLRINFCHYKHNHLLSPQLFGFAVHFFDASGQRIDALTADLPVRYALNLSLPVELQREAALLFIAELINRQAAVRPEADDFDISSLGEVLEREHERAFATVIDAMRFGWRNALETVISQANEHGWDLLVAYQGDPLPTRDDVTNRHVVLKDAYNNINDVRLFIDRFVSFFGGQGRFRIAGGSEQSRERAQGWSGLMHISEYMSHMTRDAQVLGNGYATFHTTPSPALSLRNPTDIEIGENDAFYLKSGPSGERKLIEEHTMHFRGVDQLESPYGMSILEPLVASYEVLRTIDQARQAAFELVSQPSPTQEMIDWAAMCEALYQERSEEFSSILGNMYFLPMQHWHFEPGPLYFDGYETYGP